jgi:hypothetical protein
MNKIVYLKTLKYSELEDLLRPELDKLHRIKKFCDDNKLSHSQYIKISQIRNKKNKKKYTDLVVTLLKIFGYEVENETYYRVKKREADLK